MKKSILVAILVASLVLIVTGCTEEDINPLEGKVYTPPQCNVNVFEGTYLATDGYCGASGMIDYFDTYLISLKGDGTVVVSLTDNTMNQAENNYYLGTWSCVNNTFTISYASKTYTGSVSDLTYTSGSKAGSKAGFCVYKNNYNKLYFEKVSNSLIDTSYYTGKTLTGVFGRVNDYGEASGFNFVDNKCRFYYRDGSSSTYKTIFFKNTFKVDDYSGSIRNFAVVGNYLFISGVAYQRY